MDIKVLLKEVVSFAKDCGMVIKENDSSKGNAVIRDPILKGSKDDVSSNSDFFGFIHEDQKPSGPYEDFSLVFFPQKDNNACVVSLGIGTSGLRNDLDLARRPGTRRLFTRLREKGGKTFFKNDFSDTQTPLSDLLDEVKKNCPDLKKVIDSYITYLPANTILDFSKEEYYKKNLETIKCWIATYADFRGWNSNQKSRKTVNEYLPKNQQPVLSSDEIYKILRRDKFIVLQGAPGTGKTYSALKVAKEYFKDKFVVFEQFHAETTYSDFIYGISPKLSGNSLLYEPHEGKLLDAIKAAEEARQEGKNALLIIDEINRANLSNVLGPVFYLFEKNQANRDYSIKIGNKQLTALPDNLLVIATMNTADRSLAVVDFALRRRFTWLTIKPHHIEGNDFQTDYFEDFEKLFQEYATDDELNLQPGHSYFIAKDEEHMKQRLQYELMPLIKEYINEGYLVIAKNAFSNYFYDKLGVLMYE